MKVIIEINEKDYNDIMFDVETSPRLLNRYEWLIAHGRLLEQSCIKLEVDNERVNK